MLKKALYLGDARGFVRVLGCACFALLISVALISCGDSGNDGATGSESSTAKLDPEVSTTLDVWSWNNEGDYPKTDESAVERFNEKFPNVEVNFTYLPGEAYNVKWKAALASGNPPDIMQVPPEGSALPVVQAGQLEPMEEILSKGFPDFSKASREGATLEGKEWAVPVDVNTLLIAYNKDIFRENNLKPPKTTEELLEIAAKLGEKEVQPIALGAKEKWPPADVWAAQLAYIDPSGQAIRKAESGEGSWSNPQFLEAAEELERLATGGVFAPGSSSMGPFTEALDLFASGKAAMFYPIGNFVSGGVEEKVEDQFEWGLFPFPSPNGTQPRATGGVARMFGLPTAGTQQELAAEFLRMYTNKEGGEVMMKYNFIPSWNVQIPSGASPLLKEFLEAQKTAAPRFFVYDNPEVVTELEQTTSAVLEGNADAEDVANAIAKTGEQ